MNDEKLVRCLNIAIAIVALVTVVTAAAVFIGETCYWRRVERANPASDAGTGTITGTVTSTITWGDEKEGDK